jgi:hypothetical protein
MEDHNMSPKKEKPAVSIELSDVQSLAIDNLLAGKGVVETAQLIGVAYETLSRWRNNDPSFIAAYNQRRQALWDANADRLRGAVGQAIETLQNSLESNNEGIRIRAAALILKAAGMDALPQPQGLTTPEAVQADLAMAEFSGNAFAAILARENTAVFEQVLGR